MDHQDNSLLEEKKRVARTVFQEYDRKNSGAMLIADLDSAFRSMHLCLDPEKLKNWLDDLGLHAGGTLTLDEYLTILEQKVNDDIELRELKEAFRALDRNRKGAIDVEDLRWILKNLGSDLDDEDIECMIRSADADGNGGVDFDGRNYDLLDFVAEFYALMTSE
ncbi:EF-hand calcium-binding domain-containing protein 9 [Cichlidogyrus casuarinus]|uniref:EF-hand calcium-binding domain-containing protein 9 n=1 Tax=Cichlidogyrus casuarinus TaxID=1844966 RepID=A0ABD2PUZ5_9PLAT